MNALTARTLCTLPAELQTQIRAHRFGDDLDELVQAAALALLEAHSGDTLAAIFKRARSAARRFTQDLAHHSAGLDDVGDVAAGRYEPTPLRRQDITREIVQQHGVTPRRARQIVAAQLERAKQGDLFAGNESGVAV